MSNVTNVCKMILLVVVIIVDLFLICKVKIENKDACMNFNYEFLFIY